MVRTIPFADLAGLIPAGARDALAGTAWRGTPLPGGRQVNLSLHLQCGREADRVLRVRRGPDLPGADFARELACHRIAAAAGLAPAILAADPSQGWMLMEYVAAGAWTPLALENPAALWRLGDRLRRLHALDPPGLAPVDGLALLQANCDVLAAHGDPQSTGLMSRGAALAAQLELLPRRQPVICHGDPDVGNLLGDAPLLIDFEYAQCADPTYDLALLLAYYPALEGRLAMIQKAMGLDDALSHRRLPLQLELCRIVNEAWARAQGLLSPALD